MDTTSLQAFVTVAEAGSFSQAAERLHLTQPAVSKRIFNLEQQLGCRLFDRIGRAVSLTEAGQALLPRARHILLELDDTRRLLGNLSGTVGGRLSLATSHHISLHRLPPTLCAFSREFPDVEPDLQFSESEVAYEGILNGTFELAVITLSPTPHPRVEALPIWVDQLRYVMANDHPLTERLEKSLPIDFKTLQSHPAILPGTGTFTRQIAEQHFQAEGLPLNVIISTNNLDTVRMMVSIGLGWSLLPESIIDDSLTTLPLQAQQLQRPLGLIYHKERTLSNAAQAFIRLLKAHAN